MEWHKLENGEIEIWKQIGAMCFFLVLVAELPRPKHSLLLVEVYCGVPWEEGKAQASLSKLTLQSRSHTDSFSQVVKVCKEKRCGKNCRVNLFWSLGRKPVTWIKLGCDFLSVKLLFLEVSLLACWVSGYLLPSCLFISLFLNSHLTSQTLSMLGHWVFPNGAFALSGMPDGTVVPGIHWSWFRRETKAWMGLGVQL